MKELVAKHNVPGVFGPLVELFEVDPKFVTCAEVTAGNSLFHVVVDTDETASRLIELFMKERVKGRLTYIPLNVLSVKPTTYPKTQDAVPLVKKLAFDPQFEKAMRHVFGKTLVCRNIDVASDLARAESLDCITLDGDQVNRRGALTGGYHDQRK